MKLEPRFLEKVANRAVKEGIADIVYSEFDTPLGRLLVAQSDKGVCLIVYPGENQHALLGRLSASLSPRIVLARDALAKTQSVINSYLEGRTSSLDIPVDLSLVTSEFGRRVLEKVSLVARGRVTSYGLLAQECGHPGAARAAGTALGRNPVPIVVPCHRVLPSTGIVGGYGGGSWRKQFLLELEGALPKS
ncbi:MAG: methylated-DNA--[protein]-cysteine S-methyltransferase [Actinobacteria bacterium]|nr:methylated-DNA--[protein]-cysteine S-methyltransferase [Actinomycetota bacterium]